MDQALAFDASDRDQVRLAERQERRRIEQTRSDLKVLIGMPEGRRIFRWLLNWLTPVQVWDQNAAVTGRNAMHTDTANWIRDRIRDVDPEKLLLMMQEQHRQDVDNAQELVALQNRKRKTSGNPNAPDEE